MSITGITGSKSRKHKSLYVIKTYTSLGKKSRMDIKRNMVSTVTRARENMRQQETISPKLSGTQRSGHPHPIPLATALGHPKMWPRRHKMQPGKVAASPQRVKKSARKTIFRPSASGKYEYHTS